MGSEWASYQAMRFGPGCFSRRCSDPIGLLSWGFRSRRAHTSSESCSRESNSATSPVFDGIPRGFLRVALNSSQVSAEIEGVRVRTRSRKVARRASHLGAKGLLGIAAVSLAWLGLLPISALAATSNPYSGTGYDVSYPNCSAPQPPNGAGFALIGVGGGRAFTSNSCAASELKSAAGLPVSLYYNTGYAGSFGRQIVKTCLNDVSNAGVFGKLGGHKLSQAQQAWEIGCSEASYAANYASNSLGESSPVSWWADVETGNSWSTNTSLNQFALDGMSYFMSTVGGGGFYSSPSMWAKITGGPNWDTTPAMSGSWVAGLTSCPSSTSSYVLGGVPTWLVQSGSIGGLDKDTACS